MKTAAVTGAVIALALCAGAAAAQTAVESVFGPDSAAAAEDQGGFVYTIPGEAEALPGLAEQLGNERETARIAFEENRATYIEMAPESAAADYLTFQMRWAVAGRAGNLLSLAAETYRYDGGAHGNTEFAARLWDTAADHGVDLPYLFTDRYAALSIIDRAYCARLRAMQDERGVDTSIDEWWGRCPLLHEMTVFPRGEPGAPFTSIGVLVPPYLAGPYAAGAFEIEVPVTAGLIALLRPEYRDAFAPGG